MDSSEYEPLMSVGRIYDEKSQSWFPSLKDEKSHDITPLWTASLMYLILDRHLGCIPDDTQQEYLEETLKLFKFMTNDGSGYIDKIEDK